MFISYYIVALLDLLVGTCTKYIRTVCKVSMLYEWPDLNVITNILYTYQKFSLELISSNSS